MRTGGTSDRFAKICRRRQGGTCCPGLAQPHFAWSTRSSFMAGHSSVLSNVRCGSVSDFKRHLQVEPLGDRAGRAKGRLKNAQNSGRSDQPVSLSTKGQCSTSFSNGSILQADAGASCWPIDGLLSLSHDRFACKCRQREIDAASASHVQSNLLNAPAMI